MVQVRGTVHDVSDNPDRVEKIIVRAVEPRMHGTTYITEESAQFPVVNGVLDFNVLPGPCVVAFLRPHGATTYEKLLVPDVAEATFRECLDAAALAEEGTKSALEEVVRQIQEELNKAAPLMDEMRSLHTSVNESKTVVDGYVKDAQNSAAEAATSETNAKGYENTAGDYASVATTAATEAVNAMERATEIAGGDFATHEYVDGAVANALRVDTTVGTRLFFGKHMVYGDTGRRALASWDDEGNITGNMPEGLIPTPGVAGYVAIRRENNLVTMYIRGGEAAQNIVAVRGLGFGYSPVSNTWELSFCRIGTNTVAKNAMTRLGAGHVTFSGVTAGDKFGDHQYHVVLRWAPVDDWPTGLPGTPA